jgi:hypothetical protein
MAGEREKSYMTTVHCKLNLTIKYGLRIHDIKINLKKYFPPSFRLQTALSTTCKNHPE